MEKRQQAAQHEERPQENESGRRDDDDRLRQIGRQGPWSEVAVVEQQRQAEEQQPRHGRPGREHVGHVAERAPTAAELARAPDADGTASRRHDASGSGHAHRTADAALGVAGMRSPAQPPAGHKVGLWTDGAVIANVYVAAAQCVEESTIFINDVSVWLRSGPRLWKRPAKIYEFNVNWFFVLTVLEPK